MRAWEIERLARTPIGERVEYDDVILIPEPSDKMACEDCYFIGMKECSFVPCSSHSRMDEKDCVYVEDRENEEV